MKIFRILLIFLIFFNSQSFADDNQTIYDKIDVFSEVLEKINKEYVDEVNQSDAMDSYKWCFTITRSYSSYMSPKMFESMQQKQGKFADLVLKLVWRQGSLK